MDLAQSHLVAFPRPSLTALRSALFRETGGAFASFLQEAGYAGGESTFAAFRQWLAARGVTEAEALDVETFQSHAGEFFREMGWGSVAIAPLHDVVALVDSENWAEADPGSGMQHPACHYTTGLFADFFGRTAAAPLAVLEVECRSSGANRCRFLVGSAEVMGHLYERMGAGVSYSDAAGELA
ncbi:MAG: V4R domain-containing protein [Gemmatimonadales bacterium]